MKTARDIYYLSCMTFIAMTALSAGATAFATTVPITFDSYATGGMIGQDGWMGAGNASQIAVSTTNPISGAKSLRVDGTSIYAISGILSDPEPAAMSWLVRVDNLGTGTSSDAGFESGMFGTTTTNVSTTLLTAIFHHDGTLRYYVTVGGLTHFPGNPTYSPNTVYRVEVTNLSKLSDTFDFAIYNNSNNALVASKTNLPLQANWDTNPKFYVQTRNNPGSIAYVDDFTTAVPEPSSLVLAMFGFLAAGWKNRRQWR